MKALGTKRIRIWTLSLSILGGGTIFQLLPSCETILTTVNPCGTIFGFCSPYEIDELFLDVPDYDYDPTCTIPGFGYDVNNQGVAGGCSTSPVLPDRVP